MHWHQDFIAQGVQQLNCFYANMRIIVIGELVAKQVYFFGMVRQRLHMLVFVEPAAQRLFGQVWH